MARTFKGVCDNCRQGSFALKKRLGAVLCPACFAVAGLETPPAQKRVMKMENALCEIIRQANAKPSRALLAEIQQVAMCGVGLVQPEPSR